MRVPHAEPIARLPSIVIHSLRRETFVEFKYGLDDALVVERMLPIGAFDEFCAANSAAVTSDDPNVLANLFALRQQQRFKRHRTTVRETAGHYPTR